MVTSTDGRNWTIVYGDAWEDQDPNLSLFHADDVGYGDGLWVATGIFDIFESSNGTSWEALHRNKVGVCGGSASKQVAFGGGRWFTIGLSSRLPVCTRTVDGNWIPYLETSGRHHGWDIAYGNGDWVAVGTDGIAIWEVGGSHWYWVELDEIGSTVNSVAYRDGRWIVATPHGPFYTDGEPNSPTGWTRVPRSNFEGGSYWSHQLDAIAAKP